MGKWLLKLVRWFNPVFRKQGVDTDLMYAIVELKLLMDTRRVYMSWKQGQQKENKNHLTFILIMYGLFGLFMAVTIVQMPLMPSMILFHSFIIFMMAMTLVTDFSSVLLDTADNQIILPRPVNSKTLFMARLIHVMIYLLQFSIAISGIPIIAGFITYGPIAGVMLIITSQLTVLLAVFFTYILYLTILRFSNEQRIKDIVSYFQIGMTLFFAFAYQIIPRLLDFADMTVSFTPKWYSFLLPPVWMATAMESIYTLNFDKIHIAMLALAIAGPLVLFWVMNRYLAPGFSKRLEALNTDSQVQQKQSVTARQHKGISEALSKMFCSSPVERGAFEVTWKITGRDKAFRLQFYPALGYIPIFIYLLVFNGGRNFSETVNSLPESNKFLMLIYIPLFTIASSFSIVTFNDNFQASWIYHSMPLDRPGHMLAGTMKAMIVKFFFPVYLLFFVISVFVWGPHVIDDFIMGLCNSLVSLIAIGLFSQHYLPFSRQPNVKQQSGKFLNLLIQAIVIGILVLVHFLVIDKPWLMSAVALTTAVTFGFMVKKLQSIAWTKISV